MSLEQWLTNSWVTRVQPSAQVISDLLAIAEREIADASLRGMSADGRFNLAYGAARSMCEALMSSPIIFKAKYAFTLALMSNAPS